MTKYIEMCDIVILYYVSTEVPRKMSYVIFVIVVSRITNS